MISWMTPVVCSFITAMAVGVVVKQYRSYSLDKTDRRAKKSLIVMSAMLAAFICFTIVSYLISFGVIKDF